MSVVNMCTRVSVVLVYAIHDNPNLPNCVGVDLLFVFYMYE